MASPSADVAWYMTLEAGNKADAYLSELKTSLEKYDAFLWDTRNDSTCFGLHSGSIKVKGNCPPAPSAGAVNQHKLLFTVGIGDSGEDGSVKFCRNLAATIDPTTKRRGWTNCSGPFLSMDMAGYSVDLRRTIARISALQGDTAAEKQWSAAAAEIKAAAKTALWRPELSAMFDRYADDTWVTSLQHNNLRMMWQGLFDQSMADAFVRDNLMNTSRFWTKMPMPSISVDDPHFENFGDNNWSGPPEGLTLQRAVRALEAYGHHAESVLAGAALTQALLTPACATNASKCAFPQQIDPFTAKPQAGDGYGPMILSLLEYTARRVGIAPEPTGTTARLLWSAAYSPGSATTSNFTQRLGTKTYILESSSSSATGTSTTTVTATASMMTSTSASDDSLMSVTAAGGGERAPIFKVTSTKQKLTENSAEDGSFVGVRVTTDAAAAVPTVKSLVGIADTAQTVTLTVAKAGTVVVTVKPNEEYAITRTKAAGGLAATLQTATPFTAPHA
jgi:hypothetical protein